MNVYTSATENESSFIFSCTFTIFHCHTYIYTQVGKLTDIYHFILNEDSRSDWGVTDRDIRSLQSFQLQEERFRTIALRREEDVSKQCATCSVLLLLVRFLGILVNYKQLMQYSHEIA